MPLTHGCGRLSQGVLISIVSQETLILGLNDLYKVGDQRQDAWGQCWESKHKRLSENQTRAPGECLFEQDCPF